MKTLSALFLSLLFALNLVAMSDTDFNRYIERAKKKIAEQNYVEAIDALKKAAERGGDTPEIFYLMADCNKKLHNYAEATKNYAYAKALERREDNFLIDGAIRLSKLF